MRLIPRNGYDVTSDYRRVLLNDPCVYCGGKATGLDHIVPRARGGQNGWQNRAPACAACDGSKSHHGLIWFLAERHAGNLSTPPFIVRRPRRAMRPELPPPPPLRVSLAELAGLSAVDQPNRCDLPKAA